MTIDMKTAPQVKASIKTIATAGAKLQTSIHETAIQCLMHAKQHGDVTLLASLLDAMPRSTRREDFKTWVFAFAPIAISFDKKQGKHVCKGVNITDEDNWKLEEAEATPFWELTVDKASQQFYTPEQLVKALQSLASRAEREANKQLEAGEETNVGKLVEMSTQVNKLVGTLVN